MGRVESVVERKGHTDGGCGSGFQIIGKEWESECRND